MAKIINSIKSVIDMANRVKKYTGKGIFSQICDLVALRLCNPTCGISDYYWFQIYNIENCSRVGYENFAGWRVAQDISRLLNSRVVVSAAWDKLTFATIAEAHGIPVVFLMGAYHPQGKIPEFVLNSMGSIEEIKTFLENPKHFPVFVKPAYAQQGVGGFYIVGFDKESNQVLMRGGGKCSFADFIRQSINLQRRDFYKKEAGYLFQEAVVQHKEITKFTGHNAPSGFRIVVLNTDDGPVIHRAVWKITVPGNNNDNFSMGKYGNLVVNLDKETGRCGAAIDGLPPYASSHERHPVTGLLFKEFTIPMWDKIMMQVIDASKVFNTMGILHWDVILTDSGPVFLELNDLGGMYILQVNGQGVLDDVLKDFIRKRVGLSGYGKLDKLINRKV